MKRKVADGRGVQRSVRLRIEVKWSERRVLCLWLFRSLGDRDRARVRQRREQIVVSERAAFANGCDLLLLFPHYKFNYVVG